MAVPKPENVFSERKIPIQRAYLFRISSGSKTTDAASSGSFGALGILLSGKPKFAYVGIDNRGLVIIYAKPKMFGMDLDEGYDLIEWKNILNVTKEGTGISTDDKYKVKLVNGSNVVFVSSSSYAYKDFHTICEYTNSQNTH